MAILAHLAGKSLEDGEVGFVACNRTHPRGEFVLVEVDLESLLFGVCRFFGFRESGESHFIWPDAIGFADEDEALGGARPGKGVAEGSECCLLYTSDAADE